MRHQLRSLGATVCAVAVLAVLTSVTPAAATATSTHLRWSADHVPVPGQWFAVAYAHNQWIASGRQDYVVTSSNGVTWTKHSVPDGSWQSLAYGDGKWVSLSSGYSPGASMTSTDGVHWTSHSVPGAEWAALVYADGRFVAVGFAGDVMTSTDGLHWTASTEDFGSWYALTYGDGEFVAVDDDDGGQIMRSSNGHTWTQDTVPAVANGGWGSVAYGNGVFVAFDGNGSGVNATSPNGITWTLHSYSDPGEFFGGTFGCNLFVALGTGGASGNVFVSTSLGTTLTTTHATGGDSDDDWSAVGFGGDRFVATDDENHIATATVGPTCTQQIPDPPAGLHGTVGVDTVKASWAHPSVSGATPISSYTVTATAKGSTRTCTSSTTTCTLTGLATGKSYSVTVLATNAAGHSAPSVAATVLAPRSASFVVTPAAPVVIANGSVPVTVSGATPGHRVTVVGTATATCVANGFGQCVADAGVWTSGQQEIYATEGSTHTPSVFVDIAVVTTNPGETGGSTFSVAISGGVPSSTFSVTPSFDGYVGAPVTVELNGSGDGSVDVTCPALTSEYTFDLAISDDGYALITAPVDVTVVP